MVEQKTTVFIKHDTAPVTVYFAESHIKQRVELAGSVQFRQESLRQTSLESLCSF